MRKLPTTEQVHKNLRRAAEVAKEAAAEGKHPFGAILVDADNETVLLEQGNINTVNHAESTLARRAAEQYTPEELWYMTLYTTVEPCAMCAGTQYWANIGRLVYGMSEKQLLDFTGNHPDNPTMELASREVFAHGQKAIEVIGPVVEMIPEIAAIHVDFWKH
jgi:tRNA(Arg) A34 adenosine deaminase TadA